MESAWVIHEGDALAVLRSMDSDSVDAIVTDPPYFKVKGEAWDHAWDKPEQFLEWLGMLATEWQRVLRANGSLYVFASPRMAARVEVLLGTRFEVLSHIVWDKGTAGAGNKTAKELLRSYWPASERLLFCEHTGADSTAKGEAGYVRKCDELRGVVFAPVREYLAQEWARAGLSLRDANAATGTHMASHWFTAVQWDLPTERHYATLQAQAGAQCLRRDYASLRAEYEALRLQYEAKRMEYEALRRPFAVSAEVPFTDVWHFAPPEKFEGRHVCEKPVDLLQHIVHASTRPGAVVLDCFAGSGSTGEACLRAGRTFIGVERDAHWVRMAKQRLALVAHTTAVEAGCGANGRGAADWW